MKKIYFYLPFFIISALFLVACSGGGSGEADNPDTPQPASELEQENSVPVLQLQDAVIKAIQATQQLVSDFVLEDGANIQSQQTDKSRGYTSVRQSNNTIQSRMWNEEGSDAYDLVILAEFFDDNGETINSALAPPSSFQFEFSGYSTIDGIRLTFSDGKIKGSGAKNNMRLELQCMVSAPNGISFLMNSQDLKIDVWRSLFTGGQIESLYSPPNVEVIVSSNICEESRAVITVMEGSTLKKETPDIDLRRNFFLGDIIFGSDSANLTHPYIGDMTSDKERRYKGEFFFNEVPFNVTLIVNKKSYVKRICGVNARAVWNITSSPTADMVLWADYYAQDVEGNLWQMGFSKDNKEYLPENCDSEIVKKLPSDMNLWETWSGFETHNNRGYYASRIISTEKKHVYNNKITFYDVTTIVQQDANHNSDAELNFLNPIRYRAAWEKKHWNRCYGIIGLEQKDEYHRQYRDKINITKFTGDIIRHFPDDFISDFSAKAGDRKAVLKWEDTSDSNEYRIYYKNSPGVTDSNHRAIFFGNGTKTGEITGLINGTRYYFLLEARKKFDPESQNILCAGFLSDEISILLPPSTPLNFTAVSADQTVWFNWSSAHGATEYFIYYKDKPDVSTSDNYIKTTGTFAVITDLTNVTKYYFRVQAVNSGGSSKLSDEIYTTPFPHIDLVPIAAGTFTMGSTGLSFSANEQPQHQVTISNNLYMGKYEVTQKLWLDVMGYWPDITPSSSYGMGDNNPAYNVSWTDITMVDGFLDKLNQATGCNTSELPTDISTRYHPINVPTGCFRLPTEAEWEYAARAGTTTKYYWGDGNTFTDIAPYAWYGESYVWHEGSYGTKEVGRKSPNAWGLYDMSGNVQELVYDWYDSSYYSGGSMTDPTGPTSGSYRVSRGGCWYGGADSLRSANRNSFGSRIWRNDLGFRLVFAIPAGYPDVLPVTPRDVSAMADVGQVTVTWSAVSGATEYRVYYRSSLGVTIMDPQKIFTDGKSTSHTFTGLDNGITYYFRVEAWNIAGVSPLSSEVSATPGWRTVQGIELVHIPAGSFMMGDRYTLPTDIERQVTISNNFYMGKYEVTHGQWKTVIGNNSIYFSSHGDSFPVETVSWTDITEVDGFLDKLNQAAGCNTSELPTDTTRYHPINVPTGCFRLPTEAEWEYSVRAGTTTEYYWGDGDELADIDPYAWYRSNSGGTKEVGRKSPNAWGLYDMSGNVSEWTYDWYDSYMGGSVTDPTGPTTGSVRVHRGGSCDPFTWNLRSASRDPDDPDVSRDTLGFRLVFEVTQ